MLDGRLESWQRGEALNIILEQLDETPLPEVAPIIPTPAPENEPPPVPGETDAA